MNFAQLDYEVTPGGATEAVIHVPAVVVILLLLPGDTPQKKSAAVDAPDRQVEIA
jgi:hypothetical protein